MTYVYRQDRHVHRGEVMVGHRLGKAHGQLHVLPMAVLDLCKLRIQDARSIEEGTVVPNVEDCPCMPRQILHWQDSSLPHLAQTLQDPRYVCSPARTSACLAQQ